MVSIEVFGQLESFPTEDWSRIRCDVVSDLPVSFIHNTFSNDVTRR